MYPFTSGFKRDDMGLQIIFYFFKLHIKYVWLLKAFYIAHDI